MQIAGWLRTSSSPKASASCSRPSICACRCAACRSAARRTVTSALHGLVRDDARTRQEFLALAGDAAGRS